MCLVCTGTLPYWLMLLKIQFLTLDYSSLFDTPTQQLHQMRWKTLEMCCKITRQACLILNESMIVACAYRFSWLQFRLLFLYLLIFFSICTGSISTNWQRCVQHLGLHLFVSSLLSVVYSYVSTYFYTQQNWISDSLMSMERQSGYNC